MVARYEAFFAGEIDATGVRELATLSMATADGLFIAYEVNRDTRACEASFELLARAPLGAANDLRSRSDRSRKARR
jgi:hypothetical protein